MDTCIDFHFALLIIYFISINKVTNIQLTFYAKQILAVGSFHYIEIRRIRNVH